MLFCDASIWDGQLHMDDCPYIQATRSKAWKKELERRELIRINSYKKSSEYLRKSIKCPNCGRYVSRQGLANHIKDTACNLK